MFAAAIIALEMLARSESLIARGDACVARGDFDAALRAVDEADAASANAPELRAAAEMIRGAVAEARDTLPTATEHYSPALTLAEHAASPPLIGRAFEAVEWTSAGQGKWDRILELANRMLGMENASADPNRPLYLLQRGMAYTQLHERTAAEQTFAEALPLAESARNSTMPARFTRCCSTE